MLILNKDLINNRYRVARLHNGTSGTTHAVGVDVIKKPFVSIIRYFFVKKFKISDINGKKMIFFEQNKKNLIFVKVRGIN